MEQLESTEFVADFVARAGAVATDDEDDKTLSQKDDKTHKCALGAHYLALSCSISQSASFVQYLCEQKDGKQSTPSASLVAPVSGGQSVTTDICENPVASVLSVFNSPLTITNGTKSGGRVSYNRTARR